LLLEEIPNFFVNRHLSPKSGFDPRRIDSGNRLTLAGVDMIS